MHLRINGRINTLDAFKLYGCTRLSSYIFQLKREGLEIQTERKHGKNRFGGRVNYVDYILNTKGVN